MAIELPKHKFLYNNAPVYVAYCILLYIYYICGLTSYILIRNIQNV